MNDILFINRDIIEHNGSKFDKPNLRKLLSFAVKDNHFVFDERLYDQIDGGGYFPLHFKPIIYRRREELNN